MSNSKNLPTLKQFINWYTNNTNNLKPLYNAGPFAKFKSLDLFSEFINKNLNNKLQTLQTQDLKNTYKITIKVANTILYIDSISIPKF